MTDKQQETVSRTVYVMRSKAGGLSIETEQGMTAYGWTVISSHVVTLPVAQPIKGEA